MGDENRPGRLCRIEEWRSQSPFVPPGRSCGGRTKTTVPGGPRRRQGRWPPVWKADRLDAGTVASYGITL